MASAPTGRASVGRAASLMTDVASHRREGSQSGADAFLGELVDAETENLARDLDRFPQMSKEEKSGFLEIFQQFGREKGAKIDWSKIKPPPDGMVLSHESLTSPTTEELGAYTAKLAVLKLNGGLGTSMGCKGPKSVIQVRNDLSFLDLTVMQIETLNKKYGVNVPLLLMNSFNTEDDTAAVIRKYSGSAAQIKSFNQSRYPRVWRDTLLPAPDSFDDREGWYPPGHGDLYRSLHKSGMLDQLIAEGKEYLFISNIDNLGSVVDFRILKHFGDSPDCEFIMEVTKKTMADVKGGTLIEYEGRTRLLEIAQVPKEFVPEFKSTRKFKIFNTNNLWVKLSAVKRLIEAQQLHMEIIENKKSLRGASVIQYEQAVGSAIKNFRGAIGVDVPRSRFLPVKQCNDLLLVMSDLFTQEQGILARNPKRDNPALPLVKLGKEFKKVSDFLGRFETVPEIIELDHLTVSGDVRFGKGVTLKGTVIIIANEGERIEIPDRAHLENKIVTGNLRLLDH